MKLIDRQYTDVRVRSHKQLEAAMDRASLPGGLRNEVRLAFRQWLKQGWFSIHTKRIELTYGAHARKKLTSFLARSGIFALLEHCRIGKNCHRYAFNLDGIVETRSKSKAPTENLKSSVARAVACGWAVGVEVVSTFFRARACHWVSIARSLAWALRIDHDGVMQHSRVTRSGLASVILPELTVELIGQMAGEKCDAWCRLYASLVNHASVVVKRVRGRVYHALSSCPKPIRALIRMHYRGLSEPIAIVDMHATYITLLVGAMEDCDERDELIQLLQTKRFYECVNDMLAPQHRYEDRGLLKQEFQKQCLFWLPTDHRHRKLWQALSDRFPRLTLFIERLRAKYGVSGFSDWLTARESRIFIDDVLPQCEAAGIPSVPFHDAVGVPASAASQVKQMIEQAACARLGFVPSVKAG